MKAADCMAPVADPFDAVGNRTELRASIGTTLDFKNNYTYDKLRRLTDVVQAGQSGGKVDRQKQRCQESLFGKLHCIFIYLSAS